MKWSPNKSLIIYAFLIGVIAYLTPQKLNWTESYSNQHSWPYGAKAVFERLEDLFPENQIIINEESLFTGVGDSTLENINFVFINNNMNMDSLDFDQLLKLAESGNSIFIAANQFDKVLLDTLDLSIDLGGDLFQLMNLKDVDSNLKLDLSYVNLDSLFKFKGDTFISHFVDEDTIVCDLYHLGGIGESGNSVFIEKPFGEGRFYLHSIPLVFTNYHLLERDNNNYIERVFSILPYQRTYWDEYYKVGSQIGGKKSMMHVFLSEKSFQWMYWLSFLSLFLFMLFHAKRRQRMIPVLEPPKNESVIFTKNIGELYYQNSNHADILNKKINILKEYLSRKYFMHDINFVEHEIQTLKEKTIHKEEYLRSLFKEINNVRDGMNLSNTQLKKINQMINQFYTRTTITTKRKIDV